MSSPDVAVSTRRLTMVEALREALREEMRRDERVILLGETSVCRADLAARSP